MPTISNIYGHGFDRRQLSKLETLGFKTRPQVSRYMGSQICRFIDFGEGPSLELIEVANEEEYLDFVPKGMEPYCPGISLVLPKGSEARIEDFEHEFGQLHPYALHVNYDGSTDRRGPGWNYLNFEIAVVADTFIWLTEYEEPRPVREDKTDHPNGVKGILGFVFDLEIGRLREFSELVKEDFVKGALRIGELEVWSKSAIDVFPDVADKVFPLIAIILRAENHDCFAAPMDGAREVSLMSRPAVHIETNRLSWDLLVTT